MPLFGTKGTLGPDQENKYYFFILIFGLGMPSFARPNGNCNTLHQWLYGYIEAKMSDFFFQYLYHNGPFL